MTMEHFRFKQAEDLVKGKVVGKTQAAGAHFGAIDGAKPGMLVGPHAAVVGGICGADAKSVLQARSHRLSLKKWKSN